MSKAWMTAGALAALLLAGGVLSAQDRRDTDRRDTDRRDLDRTDTERPTLERRDDVARVAGEWSGRYTCVQGVTAMRLVITPSGGRNVKALMHFFAAPENPDVPEGCFTLTGEFDRRTGEIDLRQERWIVQPPGYQMIDFEGDVDRDDRQLRGKVIGPAGCTRFRLTRERASRPLPPACEKAAR